MYDQILQKDPHNIDALNSSAKCHKHVSKE